MNVISRYSGFVRESPVPRWLAWSAVATAVGYLTVVCTLTALTGDALCFLFPLAVGAGVVLALAYVPQAFRSAEIAHMRVWPIFIAISSFYFVYSLTGGYDTADLSGQWAQALGEKPFDDWHPIAHTGLIWLVVHVVPFHWFALLTQSLVIGWLLAGLYSALAETGCGQRASGVVVAMAGASPLALDLFCVLIKDAAFALSVLGIAIMLIRTWKTRGSWLTESRWHPVLLGMGIFLASFLRHNGIFYTVPLLVTLPLLATRKCWRSLLLGQFLAVLLMGGYTLGRAELIRRGAVVDHPEQRFSESIGLPMSMMSHCYVYHPESVPDDVVAFLESLAPRVAWERNYRGDFNTMKWVPWDYGRDFNAEVTKLGPERFFDMFLRTFRENPATSLGSFLHVTAQAWAPFPETLQNAVALRQAQGLRKFYFSCYYLVLRSPLGAVLAAPGFLLAVLITVGLFAFVRFGFSVLPLWLPLAAYSLLTMLWLTGNDYRFFLAVVVCAYAIGLALLTGRQGTCDQKGKRCPRRG